MGRPPKKKEGIERAALELFVEKGVDGTSIRDIAQRAEVTEGALYRHHRSKDDLVRYLFHRHYAGFAELLHGFSHEPQPFGELVPKLVRAFFQFYDRDPYIFRFVMLVRHHLLEEVRADENNPVEVFSVILKNAERRREIPRQDTALTTQLLLGLVLQVAVASRYGRVSTPLVKHSDRISRACLNVALNP